MVSHDRYFLDRTVEHVFVFEGDGVIKRYPGNYSVYLEMKAAASKEEVVPPKKVPEALKPALPPPSNQRKLNSREKKEMEQLEQAIATAEARQADIGARLAAAGSNFQRVQELSAELHELQAKHDRDMARWSELAEIA